MEIQTNELLIITIKNTANLKGGVKEGIETNIDVFSSFKAIMQICKSR